jgi:hypothetical protein
MNDFFGFDFVGILILLCILIYLLFDLPAIGKLEIAIAEENFYSVLRVT